MSGVGALAATRVSNLSSSRASSSANTASASLLSTIVRAVSNLTYQARLGRTLAIVGESGSGKSVSSMAVLGLHNMKRAQITGSIKLDGFSTLYMSKLHALKNRYRGLENEDEMVAYLPHCTFNLNPRAASIDTPLHAYIAHKHVDHMHPDSCIAIAACKNSRELTAKIFEGELGWLPWQRPGYDLGLKLEAVSRENPQLKGIILEGHGLFTWGKTSKECYDTTLRIINKAAVWLQRNREKPAFKGSKVEPLADTERRATALRLLPTHRLRRAPGWGFVPAAAR